MAFCLPAPGGRRAPIRWIIKDPREHVGQPGMRIFIVELGSRDQRIEGRRPAAAFIRTRKVQLRRPTVIAHIGP